MTYFARGEKDFWTTGVMLNWRQFVQADWTREAEDSRSSWELECDYYEYCEGFEAAWAEHDLEIERAEKPWLFYNPESWDGRATCREYILLKE